MRIIVLGHSHQPLAGERRGRSHGEFVDVLRQLVAVVNSAQLDRVLGGLRQSHAGAAAFAEHALVGDFIILGLSAKIFRGDLLQLLLARPSPPRDAARVIACVVWLPPETQVHGRFFAELPQVISHFSHGTPSISAATRWTSLHRFRAEIADARLDVDLAIGLDHEKPVETDRAADVTC